MLRVAVYWMLLNSHRRNTERFLENTDQICVPVAAMMQSDVQRRTLLAVCFSINLLYGAYLAAIGVLLPHIGAAFRINSAEQGKIMSAGFMGSVVSVLICGFLSDRFWPQAGVGL